MNGCTVSRLALLAVCAILLSEREGWCDPIHEAALAGDVAKVRELVEKDSSLVRTKDKDGNTALHWAAFTGKTEVVEFLLNSKADVNARNGKKVTPLHLAAFKGHKDVAQLLLENKAKVGVKDERGKTPLDWAVLYNHEDIAELLRQYAKKKKSSP